MHFSTPKQNMKPRVTRARARLERAVGRLGFGEADDAPAAPKMLDWGLKDDAKAPTAATTSRAKRAERRAEKTDADWEKMGFVPRKIRDEERAIEKEKALNYVEPLSLISSEQEPVITLFRWLRPGIAKIDMAKMWVSGKTSVRPRWTKGFGDSLSLKGGRLLVAGLPVMSEAELRKQIKKVYYTPKLPVTIEGVFSHLRGRIANASRKQVRSVLNSLQTYQMLKPRRKPLKNEQTTMVLQPGRIGQDTFFPSKKYWNGKIYPVTVLADQWSGYTRAYLMGSEKATYSYYALKLFIQELQSDFGVRVNQLLTDKGTEMAYDAMLNMDFPRITHMQSPTGNAVPFIEAKVKLIQSRLWVARTGYDGRALTISDILDDVITDINLMKRPTRGNLTPTQLLKITPKMRSMINTSQRNSVKMVSNRIHGLPDIFKGDTVRLTRYTRKEQDSYGVGMKWFRPKWTERLHVVISARAVANGRLKYRVTNSNQGWWRWEMLKVDPDVDKVVPPFDAGERAKLITKARVS